MAEFNDYTWELCSSDKEFFDGSWQSYEDSNGYTNDEMMEIKEAYVNGNTALFHEIVKLMKDDCDPKVSLLIHMSESKYHMYRVDNSVKIKSYFGDFLYSEVYTFDAVNSIEEIRAVVDYITNAREHLPIHTISMIKRETLAYTATATATATAM